MGLYRDMQVEAMEAVMLTPAGGGVFAALFSFAMFWLIPDWLHGGMGMMTYIVVPVVMLSGLALIVYTAMSLSLYLNPVALSLYPILFSYLVTQGLAYYGLFGVNHHGIYFGYAIFLVLGLVLSFEFASRLPIPTLIVTAVVNFCILFYFYVIFGFKVLRAVSA